MIVDWYLIGMFYFQSFLTSFSCMSNYALSKRPSINDVATFLWILWPPSLPLSPHIAYGWIGPRKDVVFEAYDCPSPRILHMYFVLTVFESRQICMYVHKIVFADSIGKDSYISNHNSIWSLSKMLKSIPLSSIFDNIKTWYY